MGSGDLWVFGYGSLMWRPGFAHEEARQARVTGLHRGFYVYSTHHRGSPSRPGLVLALDQGGVCDGVAFRVPRRDAADVVAYLREREQVTGVYRETIRPILVHGHHEPVRALFYVVERRHAQYAGRLALSEQAHIIKSASGRSGCNLDYLLSTVQRLRSLGIRESHLERLQALCGSHLAGSFKDGMANPRTRGLLRELRQRPASVGPLHGDRLRRMQFRRNM